MRGMLNESHSLGIAVHQRDESNDIKEISSLADYLKIITYDHNEILLHM